MEVVGTAQRRRQFLFCRLVLVENAFFGVAKGLLGWLGLWFGKFADEGSLRQMDAAWQPAHVSAVNHVRSGTAGEVFAPTTSQFQPAVASCTQRVGSDVTWQGT